MARFLTGHHIWDNLFNIHFGKLTRKNVKKKVIFLIRIVSSSVSFSFYENFQIHDLPCQNRPRQGDLEIHQISLFENFRKCLDFHERLRRAFNNSKLFLKKWTGSIERQIQVFFWKNREKSDFRVVASHEKKWFLWVHKMICLISGS